MYAQELAKWLLKLSGQARWPRKHRDVYIGAFLFLSAAIGVGLFASEEGISRLYQNEYSPAITLACRGESRSLDLVKLNAPDYGGPYTALLNFLNGQASALACDQLPADLDAVSRASDWFQSGQRYLNFSTAGVWQLFGVDWSKLALLIAFFAGSAALATYVIMRLFLSRPWAVFATAAVVLSPLNFAYSVSIRDYSKAPFILTSVALSACLLTQCRSWRSRLWISASIGLVAGIGFGFRTDLLLVVPVGLAAIALLDGASWGRKFCAALVLLLCFVAAAAPILPSYLFDSFPVYDLGLLGWTSHFDGRLGLAAVPYAVGPLYHDLSIANQIDAFAARYQDASILFDRQGGWIWPNADYSKYSFLLYKTMVETFPADWLLRNFAALLQILDLPSAPERMFYLHIQPAALVDFLRRFSDIRDVIWLRPAGPFMAWVLLAIVGTFNWRRAAFLYFLVFWFGVTASFQFDARHVFHLEFIYWLGFALLLQMLAWSLARVWADGPSVRHYLTPGLFRRALFAASCPIALAAVGGICIFALRYYQSSTVAALFADYALADRQAVRMEEGPGEAGKVLLRPLDPLYDIGGNPVRPQAGDIDHFFVSATIDPQRCDGPLEFRVRYATRSPGQDLSRTVLLSRRGSSGGREVFFTLAYDAQVANFLGIEMDARDRPCLTRFSSIRNARSLPLYLWAELVAPDDHPRHYSTFVDNALLMPFRISGRQRHFVKSAGSRLQADEAHPAIEALPVAEWETITVPAAICGTGICLNGVPPLPQAYAAKSKELTLTRQTIIAARGVLRKGGVVIGLLNASDQWAASALVTEPGEFLASVEVPESGRYRLVIANYTKAAGDPAKFEVSEIGPAEAWLPPAD